MKKALIISLAFNAVLVLFFIGKRYYVNRFPDQYPAYSSIQASYHKTLPLDSTNIVFVGNSITASFPVEELFGSLKVKNRGIGGNRIIDIKKRLPAICQAHPQKIFLNGGTNDITKGMPADSVYMGEVELIEMVRMLSPKTELIYQSILPFAGQRAELNSKVSVINDRLEDYCKSVGVRFIDLESKFLKDGVLNPDYTLDGTHLNGMGYLVWRDAVKELVK